MNFKVQPLHPDELSFDYRNPRIAEFNVTASTPENEIIKIMWLAMGVEEIVLSIKASGFFEHEPLFAVKEEGKNIVIEGNRRLAAVKCLLNPELADYIGINKNLLLIDEEKREQLKALPVIFESERKDAWKFIGFKHINGPAKWGSYAKAQYISQIKNEYGISLAEIASQIGDTHKTVQKLYQGLQVIEQAERENKFDRTDIPAPRLYFSHLYTALGYDGYKEYLGIKNVSEETSSPVPPEKLDNLEQILVWLFGSKKLEAEPVIQSQNPDLRRLESVLKSGEAIYELKKGQPLAIAFEISQPAEQNLEQSLLDAKRSLQKAQSFHSVGFDGKNEKLLRLSGTILRIAEDLYDSMEKKWKAMMPGGDVKRKIMTEDE